MAVIGVSLPPGAPNASFDFSGAGVDRCSISSADTTPVELTLDPGSYAIGEAVSVGLVLSGVTCFQ